MRTDPAILEIIQNFYSAVCCGMGYVIERTSYSTFVTESADYATALTLPILCLSEDRRCHQLYGIVTDPCDQRMQGF